LTVEVPPAATNGHAVNGNGVSTHKKYELTLPVTGADTAAKLRDKNAVPSNAMFEFKAKQV
jgi:carboxymethylenebutenolidase